MELMYTLSGLAIAMMRQVSNAKLHQGVVLIFFLHLIDLVALGGGHSVDVVQVVRISYTLIFVC